MDPVAQPFTPVDYVINFDFEEVNAAVLRNAQLYLRRKRSRDRVCVIVPWQFKALFKDADCVAVIGKELLSRFGVGEYREVLNYRGYPSDAGRLKRRTMQLLRKAEHGLIRMAGLFGADTAVRAYTSLYYSGRQRKFYIDSGLEKYCLKILKAALGNFRYIRVADYFDCNEMAVCNIDLTAHFNLNFAYLASMIKDRALYAGFMPEAALISVLETPVYGLSVEQREWLRNFIQHKGRKFILRTRNFPVKAVVHNSSPQAFTGLARALLSRGALVLNLGCPLLKLNARGEGYCEIDHNLPFELELALCRNADAAAMTGGAGLFTAFAASAIKIIQMDEEWSELLNPPVRLMQARSVAGLADLDIRKYIVSGDFEGAANFIIESLKNSSTAPILERTGTPVQTELRLENL